MNGRSHVEEGSRQLGGCFLGGEDRCCDAADGQLFLCAHARAPMTQCPSPFSP